MKKDLKTVLKQATEIKSKYPDSLVFIELGQYYYCFGQDAINVNRDFDLLLNDWHKDFLSTCFLACDLDKYLPIFTKSGYKVALCQELKPPKKTVKDVCKDKKKQVVRQAQEDAEKLLFKIPQSNFSKRICKHPQGVKNTFLHRQNMMYSFFKATKDKPFDEKDYLNNLHSLAKYSHLLKLLQQKEAFNN